MLDAARSAASQGNVTAVNPDPVFSARLLRHIAELGPLSVPAIVLQAGDLDEFDMDRFGIDEADLWAQARELEGLLEPSPADPAAWQITEAGRRLLEAPPG